MAALNPIFETLAGGAVMLVGFAAGVQLQKGLRRFGPLRKRGSSDATYTIRRMRNAQLAAGFNVPAPSFHTMMVGTTSALPFEEEIIERLAALPAQASNPPLPFRLAQRLADDKPGPELPYDERIEVPETWRASDYWTGPKPRLWHSSFAPGTLWCTGRPRGEAGRVAYVPPRYGSRKVDRDADAARRAAMRQQKIDVLNLSKKDKRRLLRDLRQNHAAGRVGQVLPQAAPQF